MTVESVTRTIDARDLPCPGPLMNLIGAMREAEVGDVIEVLSSDAGSRTDIPAWIAKAQQELIEVVHEDGFARFVVRKAR